MNTLNFKDLAIELLGHDTVRVKSKGFVIYVDPYVLDPEPDKADLILITHEHFDHCDPQKIAKIQKEETVIVAPGSCISKVRGDVRVASAGKELRVDDVFINMVEAYNVNKFRMADVPFHPKGIGVGYVFEFRGVKIFHLGDSDNITEMKDLAHENIDIGFFPVSGTYVMTAEEAAQAVDAIKPKIAVPMHYGVIVGSKKDAERFKELVGGKAQVEILV